MTETPLAPLTPGTHLLVADPAALAAALADHLAARLGASAPADDPWLNVNSAADYLDCKAGRLHDLVSQDRIRFAKEGGRLVFRRSWLDAAVKEATRR